MPSLWLLASHQLLNPAFLAATSAATGWDVDLSLITTVIMVGIVIAGVGVITDSVVKAARASRAAASAALAGA